MSDLVGNPEDRFSRVAAQLFEIYRFNVSVLELCVYQNENLGHVHLGIGFQHFIFDMEISTQYCIRLFTFTD